MFFKKAKKIEELERKITFLEGSLQKMKEFINDVQAQEFDDPGAGYPLLHIKLGDERTGWIPSKEHFILIKSRIKKMNLDKEYRILLTHYGVNLLK